MKRIYYRLISSSNTTGRTSNVGLIFSVSKGDAMLFAHNEAKILFPVNQGWSSPAIDVEVIPDDAIVEAYQELMKEQANA